jgi:hypothetical protein
MSSDKQRATSSKVSSTLNQTNSLRKTNSAKLTFNDSNITSVPKNDLLSKEEEYKRLNAELEKKTATLVYEAEQVLKANEKLLQDADHLNKISDVDFLRDDKIRSKSFIGNKTGNLNLIDDKELNLFKKKINRIENEDDDENEEHLEQKENEYEETDLLGKLIMNKDNFESNLIPKVANEMSSEAQIRFLKAKLKVLQEEIERLAGEVNKREEENVKLAQRCKELDEDRAKQLRISNSHQTQMEKFKKLNEEQQVKINQIEVQLQSLKKENEQFKKDSKKYNQDQQQQELRLNRALEECEKYKQQLQKTQSSSKDTNEQEKKKLDQFQMENKRLQKQKNELILAFKKQLKLIDILKKQKMHLEASRILQFTEEEFINALEWNSSNQIPTQINNASSSNTNKPKRPGSGLPPASGSNRNSNRQHQIAKHTNKTLINNNQSSKPMNASRSESDLNKSVVGINYNDDDLIDYSSNNNQDFVLNDLDEKNFTTQNYDDASNDDNNNNYEYFNKVDDDFNNDEEDD